MYYAFLVYTLYFLTTVPAPQVTVVPPSGGRGAEAGVVYSLMCQVDSNEAYVDTAAEAVVVWRNGEGEPITTNERVTVSETEMVPGGGYRSSLIYRPLSVADRGDYNCSVVVTPDASWPFVTISSAEYDTYFLNVMSKLELNLKLVILLYLYINCSSITAKCDTINEWFWVCWRATEVGMCLSVHPTPSQASLSGDTGPTRV